MIKQKILFNCNFKYMQCNKVFEITGAIKNSSREKSKKLLGIGSLEMPHWYRKLYLLQKNVIKDPLIPRSDMIPCIFFCISSLEYMQTSQR